MQRVQLSKYQLKIIQLQYRPTNFCTSQHPPTGWCGPEPIWVEMAVCLFEGPSYPRYSSFTNHFFTVLPSKQPQKSSTQPLRNRSTVFSLLPSLSLARLPIFLLLMSGNVYPNLGPIFSCSVCTGNMTWRSRSVQCCTGSKWVH